MNVDKSKRELPTVIGHSPFQRNLLLGFELCLLATVAFLGQRGMSSAAEIEFVTIGDPGNAHYPYSYYFPSTSKRTGWRDIGGIPYTYRISKYEITRGEWLEFLNSVDPEGMLDPLGANNKRLFSCWCFTFNTAKPSGQKYALVDGGLNGDERLLPVSVYYSGAARFCNWLHNGKGGQETTEGTASSGAYDTSRFDDGDPTNDPDGHNPGARFWIPSEGEWIKAGHYKSGGTNTGYWRKPTCSDVEPRGEFPPGGTNSINAYQLGCTLPSPGKLLTIGSYPQSIGPYNTFDMGGNAGEWTESWYDPAEIGTYLISPRTCRMMRGGGYMGFTDHADICYRWPTHATSVENDTCGLRLAAATTVPDANGDGLPDAWQVANFGSADSPDAAPQFDYDGDGMCNLAEYVAGTCPTNSAEKLQCSVFSVQEEACQLSFLSVTGREYGVKYCDDLLTDSWGIITNGMLGTGEQIHATDTNLPSRRFYRIEVRLQ